MTGRLDLRERGPEPIDKRVDAAASELLRLVIPKLREVLNRGFYGKVGVSLMVQDGILNHVELDTKQTLKVAANGIAN